VTGRILLRGVLAGGLAGVFAFLFARIFAEPVISRAIDYEDARHKAQDALDQAAGLPTVPHGQNEVSRGIQANLGVGVGLILFGAAMGALVAVVYTVCLGRTGKLRPRTLAVLVAAAGFLTLYLVPFLKYPADPPAIGHEDTIRVRSGLYLLTVAASIAFLALAVWFGRKLRSRWGSWTAMLVAGGVFLVAVAALMIALPEFGMLASNVEHFGARATETPFPLTDSTGAIVFPGFPADELYQFRLFSVASQLVLWTALALIFAPLVDRLSVSNRPADAALSV